MLRSSPVDGFRLAYERHGEGPPVVLLHGWPGDRGDYREVVPLLAGRADVIVPDLRGFGASDRLPDAPPSAYAAQAQARSVLGLLDELGMEAAVLAGYDVGSRLVQAVAASTPERARALVVGPPLPGAGERVLRPEAQREFWYQAFHQLDLAVALLDGDRRAVRAYLEHFWSHWSGPGYAPPEAELDRLADAYAAPGAFTASIQWYRAGSGTVARSLEERPPAPADRIPVPTTVLWPEHDPLFPPAWGDRVEAFFSDVRVRPVPGAGHFLPLEAPQALVGAIGEALGPGSATRP
jgi:pimeloyl-ACP methyl ester carboxylesterase